MNTVKHLLWVGGWASPMRVWQSELEKTYPNCRHAFLDVMELIHEGDGGGILENAMQGVDVVVAWSMGTLALHQWLAGQPGTVGMPHQRFISLCPIFDFCKRPGGWPARTLKQMELGLRENRIPVLDAFFKRMFAPSQAPDEWLVRLHQHGEAYSTQTLADGLTYLRERRVDPAALAPHKDRIAFVIAREDGVSPIPQGLREAGLRSLDCQSNHLPFLYAPQIIKDLI